MKNVLGIALAVLLCTTSLPAEPTGGTTTTSVAKDEGDTLVFLAVEVNSRTATSPYANVSFGEDPNSLRDQFRSITIQNTSPFDVLIASYAGFVGHGPSGVITSSTGTRTSFNYATFYMLLGQFGTTGTTVTLRGEIDLEKGKKRAR